LVDLGCTCTSGACAAGWTSFNASCYRKYEVARAWNDARTACVAEGGDLASILSEEENTFVAAISKGARVWIGGTDGAFEGAWTWSDGSPWRYAKWNPGQPDDAEGEDCAEVSHNYHGHYHVAGHWNDLRCSFSQHYICKRPQYSDDADPNKGTCILSLRSALGAASVFSPQHTTYSIRHM
jgi:hypothetical protein